MPTSHKVCTSFQDLAFKFLATSWQGEMNSLLKSFSLYLLLVFCSISYVASETSYGPACSQYSYPPPGGWKRWSHKSTWPNGIIPGISGTKQKVVIPCNTGILLDVSITVDQLVINGWLKVVDEGPIYVTANFVIVQGKLTIGSTSTPYYGKIVFTLTDGGYEYIWNRPEGSGTVGKKAFAVIGGTVELNGMYETSKSWTKLKATAKKGAKSIVVEGDVSGWPVGSYIAIASTDYDFIQGEKRQITSVKKNRDRTTIGFSKPLVYTHWGTPIYTGIPGKYMDESAEVVLLDRRIVIQGSVDKDPLIGGHFIVVMTRAKQQITGVEFRNLGQAGNLGRYPVHFHLSKDVSGSFVKHSSIHSSRQRCLVIHGSYNLLVESNVAFFTRGHCFMLEEGGEYGNTFINNVAFHTLKQTRLIPQSVTTAVQSDDVPTTFWITNPNNSYIGNVGAGSEDSAFWFQLETTVLGESAAFPEVKKIYPKFVPLKAFIDNVGHSNRRNAFRTFKPGMKPRENGGKFSKFGPQWAKPVRGSFVNCRGYKNVLSGFFFRKSDSLTLDGGIFADNRIAGVEVHDAQDIKIQNVIILGETENVGNPSQCNQPKYRYANCEPLPGYGCRLPVDPANARSLTGGALSPRQMPTFGILIDQMQLPSEGLTLYPYGKGVSLPVEIYNVTFGNITNRCRDGAAISANGFRLYNIFSAGHRSSKLKFLGKFPRMFFAPRQYGIEGNYAYQDAGSTALSYVFQDLDGTLVGGTGGYGVTNTRALLPVDHNCTAIVGGYYGWLCPGTCYRSVGFSAPTKQKPTFVVARSDGKNFTVDGYRETVINLLAGDPYVVTISDALKSTSIWYGDPHGCNATVTMDLVLQPGLILTYGSRTPRGCYGTDLDSPFCKITYQLICTGTPRMRVVLGGGNRDKFTFNIVPGKYKC